jgi:hypothetical protein
VSGTTSKVKAGRALLDKPAVAPGDSNYEPLFTSSPSIEAKHGKDCFK